MMLLVVLNLCFRHWPCLHCTCCGLPPVFIPLTSILYSNCQLIYQDPIYLLFSNVQNTTEKTNGA